MINALKNPSGLEPLGGRASPVPPKKPYPAAVKIIHRRYRFLLLPTGEQEVLPGKHFGCVRWVYNHFICLDHLAVKGMMANPRLAKHLADAGWGAFLRQVQYKARWNDKRVVKINRFCPSSKTCHQCDGYTTT